ncbi:substrate-binding periplasmic protein [Atopomonas sediminilitoris]|uniref:substrate-binding periplasmic protein n=1 Tax=Atopomonas sediminilitoris TaxID=2919919 RepID=UPI003522B491
MCAQSASALTLCIEDADYLPFISPAGAPEESGVLVEMTARATRQAGHSIDLVRHPWKRCISMLEKGQVDMILAAIWLPERDTWGAFPKPSGKPTAPADQQFRLWTAEYPVFTYKRSALSFDGQRFGQIKTGLGGPPGYVVTKRLEEMQVLYPHTLLPLAGLRLVAIERLDGYVAERNIGLHQVYRQGLQEQIKTLEPVFQRDHWYVVFSHALYNSQPEIPQSIWQNIATIRAQDSAELMDKYQQQAKRYHQQQTKAKSQ